MQIKDQIKSLLIELNQGVLEKEKVIALSLLSALSGESIFLLGLPGVAKSLIARRLKFAFQDEKQPFEYLMNRFSTPDEIFGPVSISKLKTDDKYERIVKNYLPDASVVFLDEIWKAGPSIQNALLTVLNEKKFRNGETEISIPMKALISASNELPAEGEGLGALWDRFLVRYVVKGVEDRTKFNDMISKPLKSYDDNVPAHLKISDAQYKSIHECIDKVEIPENVFKVIHAIRCKIQARNDSEENRGNYLYVSDRRWRKIVRLLRTSALLNDRNAVDLMDCMLLPHCLWDKPEQYESVELIVKESVRNYGYEVGIDLSEIRVQIDALKSEIEAETKVVQKIQKGQTLSKQTVIKAPHPAIKKHWDAKINTMLTITNNSKSQILNIRDSKQSKDHVFTDSKYLDVVEANLIEALRETEKVEIEVKRIQYEYEHLETNNTTKPLTQGKGRIKLVNDDDDDDHDGDGYGF
ncbi:MAG: AAA family ATPase [Candidatus Riflebacteria bacterium]|nr:AAA family ATPase [Candidatus Riflebacteria bacterium]